MSLARNTARALPAALAAAAVALPLAACGRDEPDLSNGKAQFTQKCGSCHTLARAGTQGQTGPNLDTAFRTALADGMSRDTVKGIVHRQILHPRRGSVMPPALVTGDDARDVSSYVGFATARAGQDRGALAQAGLAGATSGDQIFTAAGCASCHTLSKAGAKGNIGPNLDQLPQDAQKNGKGSPENYVAQSIVDPEAFTVPGFPKGVMPSYKGRLTDKQVKALATYLLGK